MLSQTVANSGKSEAGQMRTSQHGNDAMGRPEDSHTSGWRARTGTNQEGRDQDQKHYGRSSAHQSSTRQGMKEPLAAKTSVSNIHSKAIDFLFLQDNTLNSHRQDPYARPQEYYYKSPSKMQSLKLSARRPTLDSFYRKLDMNKH